MAKNKTIRSIGIDHDVDQLVKESGDNVSRECQRFLERKYGDVDYWREKRRELEVRLREIDDIIAKKLASEERVRTHVRENRAWWMHAIECVETTPTYIKGLRSRFANTFGIQVTPAQFRKMLRDAAEILGVECETAIIAGRNK